jgi:hypothetical protein
MKLDRRVLVLMGLIFLSSYGSSGLKADDTTVTQYPSGQANKEAQKIIDQQMEVNKQKEASTFPCSLFEQSEIETLVGNPLDKGSYAFNNRFENNHQYKSESCSWSPMQGEGNEVSLWVSQPKHFDSGQVECSPGDDNRKISGIGDQAWWEYQKYFGMGTLRVCSTKAMLEVKVDLTSNDEAMARKIAQTMAEKVLASE